MNPYALRNHLAAAALDQRVLAAVRGVLRAAAPWPGNAWVGKRVGASASAVSRSVHRMRGQRRIDFVSHPRGLRGLRILEDVNT